MGDIKEYLNYYRHKLERLREDDDETILDTIQKLAKPSVTAEALQETGIYRSVHKLTKRDDKIAYCALQLYNKWKLLLTIAMQEKVLKNCSPHVKAPHPATSNHVKAAHPAPSNHVKAAHPAPSNHVKAAHPAPSNHVKAPHPAPSNHIKVPHPAPSNHLPKPRPDSTRTREAGSKGPDRNQPSTTKDQFAPDSTQDRHTSYRSSDGHTDRASRGHPRDHSVQDIDAARTISSTHRGSRQRDESAPDPKISHNPSHRSSDSDSEKGFKLQAAESERCSKFQTTKKDYFTPGDETNIFGNPCPRTVPDISEINFKLNSKRKELYNSMNSATRNSGDPGKSSEHKDCLAPDPDSTRPNSKSSELNGVCSSQDSNHTDIDSLSNPNLNIEAPPSSSASSTGGADSSPTKNPKLLEPYHIEMKEGMFRAVKNDDNAIANTGKLVFELIYREIIKGGNNSYRKDKDKFDEQKCSELFGILKEPKHEPIEPKPSTEKSGVGTSGSSKHDLKRKSSSPCSKGNDKRVRPDKSSDHRGGEKRVCPDSDHRGGEKRFCPDSTSDHKLKIKKEEKSPSQAYKPINNIHAHQSNCDRNKNSKLKDSPENAGMEFISSKKERRSIYSGKKCVQEVSTLLNSCQRFLKKNLDCLRGTKHVPYEVLQPILETLNPSQLSKVEEHNPYLLPHTNTLWRQHCNRDYRGLRVMRNEKDVIWKDEYNRAHDQQKKKLKNLTASINASASKAKPDRQAKLTLVDSQHDPLRRRSKAVEVPIVSLKPTNSAVGPRASSPAIGHKSTSPAVTSKASSSPTPKPSFSAKPSMPIIVLKPKETKHVVVHKPVKKVVAPLMSKVKKSMSFAYRQK